jgi:formylglycine-generating enzyme required for sulfatase activity
MSPEPDDGAYAKGPQLKQPQALQDELTSLTKGAVEERVEKLKRKVLKDLVFIEGGTFMMGDFGPAWSSEKLYYTPDADNKPLHKVTLTGYSLGRYKTTYAEFDVFTDATKQQRSGMELEWHPGLYRHPLVPVGIYWQRAKDYCTWLAKETGVPFDLPTEAQWEYAGRSRGKNFIWATDNGNLDIGRNIASSEQRKLLSPIVYTDRADPENVIRALAYPVGIFPPNPLGLYEMNSDGWEWMQDWHSASWYRSSPERDPKGPPTGIKRIVRGYADGDYVAGLNLIRPADDPMITERNVLTNKVGPGFAVTHSVRCAVNLDHAVAQEK